MTQKPTIDEVRNRFFNTPAEPTPQPVKRGPTIILPKRYCANRACGRELSASHKYPCCSWACQQVVKSEQDAIEAADKLREEYPF